MSKDIKNVLAEVENRLTRRGIKYEKKDCLTIEFEEHQVRYKIQADERRQNATIYEIHLNGIQYELGVKDTANGISYVINIW